MSPAASWNVALVGMSCRFAAAPDLFAYWSGILANRDATCEVPADRWPVEVFCDPNSRDNDRVSSRRGGYLQPPVFDPAAEGIMPLAVAGGEPEQYLVLAAAREALQDAEIDLQQIDRRRVQVVIGRGNYFNRGNLIRLQHGRIVAQTVGLLAALYPEWSAEELELVRRDLKSSLPPFEAATIPGQLTNATAGRLADRFDLAGASFVVDAASASSLVALELAARALVDRRADLALVGGVYIEADVDFPLVFQQLHALSPSGAARPFTAAADGLVAGEGVGVVVLRRLADAERSGNRIYAVVQGVGVASDGRGRGMTAPSARGHVRAIRRAYRIASIDPATVGLVEGHGLGVPAADRAELRALRAVFPPSAGAPRTLGAVSSQIGHAMPAAGMAGLIKAALALHHRILPPTRTSASPHPLLEGSGFELLEAPRPWIHGEPTAPRRAGVNAFGFAGMNAHAVLEEHPVSADGLTPGVMLDWDSEAILISAEDRRALADQAAWLRAQLVRWPDLPLRDLAFTLNCDPVAVRRPVKAGIVASSVAELLGRLEALEGRLLEESCRFIRDARGLYFFEEPLCGEGRLAVLFPGEGSQYPGMLADLCPHFPELRAVLDTADRIAIEAGEEVLPSRHLFGGGGGDGADSLWTTGTAVNVVLSAGWAMYQVLLRLGLQPDAAVGHSSGELAALAAAGTLRVERSFERELSRLARVFRGLEDARAIPTARLVAVSADRERVEAACRGIESVAVVIDNCPHQVVLGGAPTAVETVVHQLAEEGVVAEFLPFGRAYHTPEFAAVLEPLADFYRSLEFMPPRTTVYSCATAGRMPDDPEAIRELAIAQWTRPVAFRRTVETMHRDGLRIFVDVGARGNLCGYVEDTLRGRPCFAVAANLPRRSGTRQLNHLVASLFAHGVDLDASLLYARRRPRRVDLQSVPGSPRHGPKLQLGFPEMRLSGELIARLRERRGATSPTVEASVSCPPQATRDCRDAVSELRGSIAPGAGRVRHDPSPDSWPWFGEAVLPNSHRSSESSGPATQVATDEAERVMLAHLKTMKRFLEIQAEVGRACLKFNARGESAIFEGTDEAGGVMPLTPEMVTGLAPQVDLMGFSQVENPDVSDLPWVGEILDYQPGQRVVSEFTLDPAVDPVAGHHTLGGRRVSEIDPELKGLPVVPFFMMAEMVAEVASLLVPAGWCLERFEDLQAHRWVSYGETGGLLRMTGQRTESRPNEVRVTLHQQLPGAEGSRGEARLVFEGTARFASRRAAAPPAPRFELADSRPSAFTARRLYEEQWLFHGPALQGLVEVGAVSREGISGLIQVLPLEPLLQESRPAAFHLDPITLDVFTHLLGCWGLDCLDHGDVVFPLRMGSLTLHGATPPVGTLVSCRIRIRELQPHRVRAEADLVLPDGSVWMRIEDWEDWRFDWPARYRDVFRAPEAILVGEPLPLPGMGPAEACAVWLEPPADMGRPVWRDVLEQIQLAPAERAESRAAEIHQGARTRRLWGRIACKEAARRLWLANGGRSRYPADLAIDHDPRGRPSIRDRAGIAGELPAVSIAHAPGISVALAVLGTGRSAGIDLVPICDRDLDAAATGPFSAGELALLEAWERSARAEGVARLWAAKGAAVKAIGRGHQARDTESEVVSLNPQTGEAFVLLPPEGTEAWPASAVHPLIVHTSRRDEFIWAWTVGKT